MSNRFALVVEEVPECLVQRGQAAKHIAENFQLPVDKALAIVDGQRRVVSRGLELDEAQRYARVFGEAGVTAQVLAEENGGGTSRNRPSLTDAHIAELFSGPVTDHETRETGARTQKAAVLTLLVPLVYSLTLLALIGAGAWYALAAPVLDNPSLLSLTGLYLVPLLALTLGVAGILKPLIAPPLVQHNPYVLDRDRDPLLFTFVNEICHRIGAPAPVEIRLHCQVHTSVGFHRGVKGLLKNDLVLNVGLPLVAALTLRQFAGVLAHEFGHYAGGKGTRSEYVIYRVNRWLHRLCFGRDRWDEKLSHIVSKPDHQWAPVARLAAKFLEGTRYSYRGLRYIANAISSDILRQQEFAADRLETQIAGSSEFRNTSLKTHLIDLAYARVMDDLEETWRERRLPDNIPALVVARAASIEEHVKQRIQTSLSQSTTRVQGVHPADEERIAAAERDVKPGLMRGNGSTASLFESFSGSCKSATCRLYNDRFDIKITRSQLLPNAQYDRTIVENNKTYGVLDTYFLTFFSSLNYLAPGDFEKALKISAPERLQQLRDLCVEIRRASPEARQTVIAHNAAKHKLFETAARYKWRELNGKSFDGDEIERLTGQVYSIRAELRDFERPYTDRLELGLATALADAALESPVKAKALKRELEGLSAAQALLSKNQDKIVEIYRYASCACVAEEYARQKPKFSAHGLQDELERLKTLVGKLRIELQGVRYPLARNDGPASILEHFDQTLQAINPKSSFTWKVYALLDAIEALHVGVISRLAEIAMQAESRHGVKLKLI